MEEILIKEPIDFKGVYDGHRVTSFEELKEIISQVQMLKNSSALEYLELYRGQAIEEYKLEPGLVRHTKDPVLLEAIDKELMVKFEEEFLPKKVGNLEVSTDKTINPSYELQWKLNFQAQHMGLKTRLLDWTIDWKIALMFAIENPKYHGRDAQFWVFYCPRKWRYNSPHMANYVSIHPSEITSFHLINYPFLLDSHFKDCIGMMRQARQSGRFTIQPYAKAVIPMEEQPELQPYLIKFIIDGDSKVSIKNSLESEGLTLDWSLYRKDSSIDEMVKNINENTIAKHLHRRSNKLGCFFALLPLLILVFIKIFKVSRNS